MPVVLEISGADSIAAALAYAAEHPDTHDYVPTYASTGTEFGDFAGIERNLAFLERELADRAGARLHDLVRLEEPELWHAINGRFASMVARRFGAWLPCVGCHLYLHLLRVPVARGHAASVIVSGERERHGERTKTNQTPRSLGAYVRVLEHAGTTLALPVRHIARSADLEAILGPGWPGGSPQLSCVLSGNERGPDGSQLVDDVPQEMLEGFLVPAGIAIIDAMTDGRDDWETVVGRVLEGART